jgi:hypothetical protein
MKMPKRKIVTLSKGRIWNVPIINTPYESMAMPSVLAKIYPLSKSLPKISVDNGRKRRPIAKRYPHHFNI